MRIGKNFARALQGAFAMEFGSIYFLPDATTARRADGRKVVRLRRVQAVWHRNDGIYETRLLTRPSRNASHSAIARRLEATLKQMGWSATVTIGASGAHPSVIVATLSERGRIVRTQMRKNNDLR